MLDLPETDSAALFGVVRRNLAGRRGLRGAMEEGWPLVRITYLGHATFLVEGQGVRVLIDPYDERVGYPVVPVEATVVLVSHEHADHNNVSMARGAPRVIRGLADGQWRTVRETVDGVTISTIPTFHDNSRGSQRGRNSAFVMEVEGLRVVHLGDLGHPLDEETAGAVGRPDVLMIPVGGHYTIDASQAYDVVARVQPPVAIPMHYKTEVNATWPLAPVEDFLRLVRIHRRVGHTATVEKATLPRETEVWVMSWKESDR